MLYILRMTDGFIIVLIILIFAGIGVAGWYFEKKRREAIAALAHSLGLHFTHSKDRQLIHRLSYLDKLKQGSNRYAYNVISGKLRGYEILAFDFHYETYSSDSKGRRRTNHHYLSFVTTQLPRSFPELVIAPEGFFSKIIQAIGFDDIDFESAEFSKKYVVRSKDRKFAYDFCHAQVIDFLLKQPVNHLEVEGDCLAISQNRRFKVEEVQERLDHLISLRELIPDYLIAHPS
ncbi:MAG: hypothetical protein AAGA18_09900 [Verrucomicrobiota bacterium]